jgi:putative SOS response-associated peptidase YedK
MCGRITQKSNPQKLGLGLTTVNLIEPLQTLARYNGPPGQEHWIIRRNPKTGEPVLDRLWWGLIPYWTKDTKGGRKPMPRAKLSRHSHRSAMPTNVIAVSSLSTTSLSGARSKVRRQSNHMPSE